MLRFNGEEEAARKSGDVVDAGRVRGPLLVVSVHFDDHVPDEREAQPTVTRCEKIEPLVWILINRQSGKMEEYQTGETTVQSCAMVNVSWDEQ